MIMMGIVVVIIIVIQIYIVVLVAVQLVSRVLYVGLELGKALLIDRTHLGPIDRAVCWSV